MLRLHTKQQGEYDLAGCDTDNIPHSARTCASAQLKRRTTPLSVGFLTTLATLGASTVRGSGSAAAWAEDTPGAAAPAVADRADLGPVPTDWGLSQNDYYADAAKVVAHMRYACQMEKANPQIVEVATKTKTEMIDFVSFYRKFKGINGKQSFSLLYTSINVLAGHYTSYGTKIPVPEKRRKRLLQEFNDIEKNIKRKR